VKILLCAEVYSGNLGDPIIAAGLQEILHRVDPSIEVALFDISGRKGLPTAEEPVTTRPGPAQRLNRSLRRLGGTGRRASNLLHWVARERRRLAVDCGRAFEGVDALVIGGGQLLMDNDLNFPLRINRMVAVAGAAGIPVAVHTCGVGARWSPYAESLVSGALSDRTIRWITTRDAESRKTLAGKFPCGAIETGLSPDPALWSAEAYGVTRNEGSATVGLAVMAPEFMKPHLSGPGRAADTATWCDFWGRVAEGLLAQGLQVEIFTNGDPQDEAFADRVAARVGDRHARRLPRPLRPAELLGHVAAQSGVIGARLHTGIVAYSLRVPFVGLLWDRKVASFGGLTDRAELYFDPNASLDSTDLLDLFARAKEAGIDDRKHRELREFCLVSAREMLAALAPNPEAPVR
jgi:polysaccharide pyruvyl transferase WcaK-like protein